jgi:hypothetical protein
LHYIAQPRQKMKKISAKNVNGLPWEAEVFPFRALAEQWLDPSGARGNLGAKMHQIINCPMGVALWTTTSCVDTSAESRLITNAPPEDLRAFDEFVSPYNDSPPAVIIAHHHEAKLTGAVDTNMVGVGGDTPDTDSHRRRQVLAIADRHLFQHLGLRQPGTGETGMVELRRPAEQRQF